MPSEVKMQKRNKVGVEEHFTVAQMLKAIDGSLGIKKEVAEKLQCSYMTVAKYAKQYPEIQEALDIETEMRLDEAEVRLADAVNGGDMDAIKFTLSRKGRGRGWGADKSPASGGVQVIMIGLGDKQLDDDGQIIDGQSTVRKLASRTGDDLSG